MDVENNKQQQSTTTTTNEKHKSRSFMNPFKSKPKNNNNNNNQQQDAVANNNDTSIDLTSDHSIDNENGGNNSGSDLKEHQNHPTLTRQDSNSSINSTYSTSSTTVSNNSGGNSANSSNSSIVRPRSKSEKKDKLSINTLISKASRKSMKIVVSPNGENLHSIPEQQPQQNNNISISTTSSANSTPTTSTTNVLNTSSNSVSSNMSLDQDHFNRNLGTGTGSVNSNVLTAQEKKKNRGSIFVRLLSRKNKDDPISEEDFKIESSSSPSNGGSLGNINNNNNNNNNNTSPQFSSSPNLLTNSYSFSDKDSLHSNHNNNHHHHHHLSNHNNGLASSMIASPSLSQKVSPLKFDLSASRNKELEREETIKKIQLMATQLNENIKLPMSPRNQQSSSSLNLAGNVTPPRIDRQSSEQSFLYNNNNNNNNNNNSFNSPISTTPLSTNLYINPFENNQLNHNNSTMNEDTETDYSIDSAINIDSSSTTSSLPPQQPQPQQQTNVLITPSSSTTTSLSISSSSIINNNNNNNNNNNTSTTPVITSQPNTTTTTNKHKRYTVAIPKWDSSMNFNGNPFERLVQVLRNSTDMVNNDYEQSILDEQQRDLLLLYQIQQQQTNVECSSPSSASSPSSISTTTSPIIKPIPQSIIDGIEEEKQKRIILLFSLRKLIQKLITESSDDSILFKSFFTTYDCVFSSKDILDVLISLFKTESPQTQLRICSIIKCWLKDYNISQLCDYNFASEFKDFVMEIKNIHNSYLYDKIIELRNQLIYLLETKITERCLDLNSNLGSSSNEVDQDENNNNNVSSGGENKDNDNENSNGNEVQDDINQDNKNLSKKKNSESILNEDGTVQYSSPDQIEKRYLNKKATLKIKTFLSTSLKSTGFELDLQRQQQQQQFQPSPPSSPTHNRRFSPQQTDHDVLSLTSLENSNNNYESDYDNHFQQQQQQITRTSTFTRQHHRSTSNGGVIQPISTSNSVSFSSHISNSTSTSFSSNNSGGSNNIITNNNGWVQTRPRSSTWSSSDIFLSIMDAPAKEIAKSLTVVDFSIFICIETQELMNGAWGKAHLKDRASNIIKLISRFNEISMNVIQSILNEEKLKDRCKVMARFIKIAKNLHELRNYNSLMAIYAGISHSSITRLKWTKKILPKTHQKTLSDLEKLMESDENFKNYRNELKTITSPCIPFLGLILSDMTFIQEGNTDYVGTNEDSWSLNINKLKLMYNCIKQIQNFQKTTYLLNADPRLTLMLTPNSNIFGEPNYPPPTLVKSPHQQSHYQHHQVTPTPIQQAHQAHQQQLQDQQQLSPIKPIAEESSSLVEDLSPVNNTVDKSSSNHDSSRDLKNIFSIPTILEEALPTAATTINDATTTATIEPTKIIPNKPLEKKSSQHDLLYRSFTLEDQEKPVRKYSFNTWSSPKKVNFDYFNSPNTNQLSISNGGSSISGNNNGSGEINSNIEGINSNPISPIKMERSQSEKYLPLKAKQLITPISFNILNNFSNGGGNTIFDKILESNHSNNLLNSPRKVESTESVMESNIDGENNNNCSSVPSPSLSRLVVGNGGCSGQSVSNPTSPSVTSTPINCMHSIETSLLTITPSSGNASINNSGGCGSEINSSGSDNLKKSIGGSGDFNSLLNSEIESSIITTVDSSDQIVFSVKGQPFIKNRRKSVSTSNIHNINPLSPTTGSLTKQSHHLNSNGVIVGSISSLSSTPRSANNSPQGGSSGSVSPNGYISNHGQPSSPLIPQQQNTSLFKRKSFDQHVRPAHSFTPMSDEGLFKKSLLLEPRGVKLSDLN